MFRRISRLYVAVLFLVLPVAGMSGSPLAAPKVVATIPPVHSLTAMVMEGTGFPQLLLGGGETPHSYSLRPSQSRMLTRADIVVRVGDGLEGFLKKPLRSLAGRARIISLDRVPGVKIYANRAFGGAQGHDGHAGEDHGHDHKTGTDPHLWLHTGNALAAIREISRVLSMVDPENAPVYAGNAARASVRIRSLKMEISHIIAPVRDRPYFVFHDAWQYFEKEFKLRGGGAIAISPERKPGARRLVDMRARIRSSGARCVFAEPQFPPSIVKTVIRRTPAILATLDPLGVGLTHGPGQYPALMRNLANGMVSCLNRPSR